MKRHISAFLLAFTLAAQPLAVFAVSDASTEKDTRFFVATTNIFWKNSLGVRHSFPDGFTADLSDFQLRIAKFAGLEPVPVKRLTILPEATIAVRPAPSASVPWGIELLAGHVPAGGASVSVAILDTGVDTTHPDLARRISECADFSHQDQPLMEGNCTDENGHGTHVAGIVAADGGEDGLGIIGLAPEADLLAYRVCNADGSCWADDVAIAIRTAADHGANIINLSLGADSFSSLVAGAVSYAIESGSLVVAAAGNDGPYSGSIDWPAALDGVVAVGAIDAEGAMADWSSRDLDDSIPFVAPGVNIESTFLEDGYAILSGTSMAAPHIAGLAAVLWQHDAEHPADATREMLSKPH